MIIGYVLMNSPDERFSPRVLDVHLYSKEEAEHRAQDINSFYADGYIAAVVAAVEVPDKEES